MDFELLSENPPKPSSAFDLLERLLTHRHRHWQLWAENPPHFLGICLWLAVSLEQAISMRLFHNLGGGPSFLITFAGTAVLILLTEILFIFVAARGGEFVGKSGNFFSALTFFHMGLAPLLLLLPVSLACWVGGSHRTAAFRALVMLLLGWKVLSHWKEAIEINFKLTRVQSGLVFYAAFGIIFLGLMVFFYVNLINTIAGLVSD